jgi:phenylacetate-CoA ligase
MNPFLNPVTGVPFIISYLTDPGRLKRSSKEQLRSYRDTAFRRIVRYAFSVPVYHHLYKKAGVYPHDIKHIEDAQKLPFISKKNIIDNYPDGVVPQGYNKKRASVISTSGSTGKPVSIYVDFPTLSKAMCLFFRQGYTYDFNWRNSKFVSIGNFSQGKADQVFEKDLMSQTHLFRRPNSYLSMNAFAPMKEIINKLDEFRPDIMLSYPITFQQLAYLKKKGYGSHIKPKLITVGGYVLDEYTRSYVEDAFGCPMVNIYSSAESCSDVAFECLEKTWHVNYDYFHVEAVDDSMGVVADGESGHIILTRMFGRGTPIVRYMGMDDWVTLESDCECSCGLRTPIMKSGVEGRRSTSVVLPDGRMFPSASFAIVSLILKDLNTFKVKQFQIIQHRLDVIEILLAIDDDLRDVGPSVDFIFSKIHKAYQDLVGPKVTITVKEVDEIKSPRGKPLPLVISKVKIEDALKLIEQ